MGLRINGAGLTRIREDWSLTPARTLDWPDLDLWVLQEGHGSVETPEGIFPIGPGACLLMRGGQPYTFQFSPGKPFVHFYVHFDWLDTKGRPVKPQRAPVPGLFRTIPDSALLDSLLGRLVETVRKAQNKQRAIEYLQACLCEIRRADELIAHTHSSNDNADIKWIAELCQQIDRQPGREWTVSSMAKKLGTSRSQFFRLFNRQVGKSAQAYVIDARMRQARFLLRYSGNAISWISEQLGYRDIYFFSRQFKAYHGVNPSTYRNGNRF